MCFDYCSVFTFLGVENGVRVDNVTQILKRPRVLAIGPGVRREVRAVRASRCFPTIPVLEGLGVTTRKAGLVAILVDDPIDKQDARRSSTPIIRLRTVLRSGQLVSVGEDSVLRTSIFLGAVSVPTQQCESCIPQDRVVVHLVRVYQAKVKIKYPVGLPITVRELPRLAIFKRCFTDAFRILGQGRVDVQLLLVRYRIFKEFPLHSYQDVRNDVNGPFRELIYRALCYRNTTRGAYWRNFIRGMFWIGGWCSISGVRNSLGMGAVEGRAAPVFSSTFWHSFSDHPISNLQGGCQMNSLQLWVVSSFLTALTIPFPRT